MAGTLVNFSSSEIRVRYREPFLSEGINVKQVGASAFGVKRGFNLYAPGAGNRILGVAADSAKSDHVAVVETATHSIHLRKTGGNFTIDMTALSGQTVVVALYATYVVGASTVAQVRYYTVAEYNSAPEKPYLVVLGTVTVPGTAIPFTAAQVTHTRKVHAWANVPSQEIPWVQVLANPNLELGKEAALSDIEAIAGWQNSSLLFKLSPSVGDNSSKAAQIEIASSPATGHLEQTVLVPVTASSFVRVAAKVKVLVNPTVAVLTNLELLWKTAAGVSLTTTSIPLVVVGSTDVSFRDIDEIVSPPATSAILSSVRIRMAAQTWAATGTVMTLDNVRVFVDKSTADLHVGGASPLIASGLSLVSSNYPTQNNVNISNVLDDGLTGEPALGVKRIAASRIEAAGPDGDEAAFVELYNSAGYNKSLVRRSKDQAALGDIRVYTLEQAAQEETANAEYSDGAATWEPDVVLPSTRIKKTTGPTIYEIDSYPNTSIATFGDADWKPILKVNDPHNASSVLPVLQVGGVGEYLRNIADRFGLRFNRVTSFHENWLRTSLGTWTAGVFGGASTGFSDYAPMMCRTYFLTVTGGGASVGEIQYNNSVAYGFINAGILNIMEWEVEFTGTDINDVTFSMGWGSNGGDGVFAEWNPAANANWGLKTADGATITHDYSSISVAKDTIYRLRLEMIGNGSGLGGPALKLFVNGQLAVSKTASLPTIGFLSLAARLEDTDPTAVGGTVRISPITEMSARFLQDDNV